MSHFLLHSQYPTEVTILSNIFIDHFMPAANGTYVKVYLYLLRLAGSEQELSISLLADALDETEKDISRALRYWEDKKLLSLQADKKGTIEGITILNPPAVKDKASIINSNAAAQTEEPEATSASSDDPLCRPNYSQAQIERLTEMEEVKWLLSSVERYLERLLKPSDIQLVLYLYESLEFTAELILFLYEYCVSKNKRNTKYIETVALAWAKEGIDTVEKAEAASADYNSNYMAVNKAFGLNRVPGTVEKQFIYRWFHTYEFEISLITEACSRTLLATGRPDFKYADKILENWYKQKAMTPEAIQALDEAHAKRSASTQRTFSNPVKPEVSTPSANNKFNAFPQRQYTKEEFDDLERRLLNKKKG